MIYYSHESEKWLDDDDIVFEVDMTPEGLNNETPEFQNRLEFWRWYTGHEDCPDFDTLKECLKYLRDKE